MAIYGDKQAVPALAALLPDAELASWARIALEAIPDSAAGEALRQSLGQLQGDLLVGAINSIGMRRDIQAVDDLVARLTAADAPIASAAAVALGRIGNERAVQALTESLDRAPPAVGSAVAEGCMLCAERFLADGTQDRAVELYDRIRAEVPKRRVVEATRGAILARQAAGVPLLVEQLRSADKSLQAMAWRTARDLAAPEVTGVLVAELGQAEPDRQVLLIQVLADRGDSSAVPHVLQAARGGSGPVRLVALRALGRLGTAASVPVLLDAAQDPDPQLSEAALAVLADMPGQDVDDDLAARLRGPAERCAER